MGRKIHNHSDVVGRSFDFVGRSPKASRKEKTLTGKVHFRKTHNFVMLVKRLKT